MTCLQVTGLPAFDDNYIWMLTQEDGQGAVVVDPGDDEPVQQWLQNQGKHLQAILITHKHGDHTGGVTGLKQQWPDAQVYGPAHEPVQADVKLADGDRLELLGVVFDVLEVPGHTEGHLAYWGDGKLFCGDTLFAAGCGRVFSGSFEQLADSLQRIAHLPKHTALYCAHEYTLANLGFARWVEPENAALLERIAQEEAKRQAGQPTLPSSLELELATNPFLRTGEPAVIGAAEKWAGRPLNGHRAVFKALRQWKDRDYD